MSRIELTINGMERSVDAPPLSRLIDVLREELRLTGTKEGCGEGECGTCTVLMDGEPVNACLVPIGQCAGREVVTVEGLVQEKKLSLLASAFIDRGGAQCGICTPGMIVSAHHLLQRNPTPTDREIREALAGNICRCTGYTGIVEAVQEAAKTSKQGGKA
jgi:carbon-monoxide dehydrogenase small subunit